MFSLDAIRPTSTVECCCVCKLYEVVIMDWLVLIAMNVFKMWIWGSHCPINFNWYGPRCPMGDCMCKYMCTNWYNWDCSPGAFGARVIGLGPGVPRGLLVQCVLGRFFAGLPKNFGIRCDFLWIKFWLWHFVTKNLMNIAAAKLRFLPFVKWGRCTS